MISEEKMDGILLELGHDDFNRGTAYLREGVKLYDAGHRAMTTDIYPAIARAHNSTASRVERCMRHSIERAWLRADWETQRKWFGASVDPEKGKPTVGQFLARMAVICHEN